MDNSGNDYRTETLTYIERNLGLPALYTFEWCDLPFIGFNEVFSPGVFQDSAFFADELVSLAGRSSLEVGCGTGLISVALALRGVQVTACDIDPAAVHNTRVNCVLHGVEERVEVVESDVFSGISSLEGFDTVFWNVPFLYDEAWPATPLERACMSYRYENIRRYFDGALAVMEGGGRALFGFSEDSGNREQLSAALDAVGLEAVPLSCRTLSAPDEMPFTVGLYELIRSRHVRPG